jgi:hypothetical protein
MLIVVIPLQPSPKRQRVQIYIWTAMIMVIYSILVSFFRLKNKGILPSESYCWVLLIYVAGYPFKLFF